MAIQFRYIGVTDENTQCDRCGKMELRSTVVLCMLDADGNDDQIVYYGSTCASRALADKGTPIKGGGRAILQHARYRTDKLRADAQDARERLAKYDLPQEPVQLTPRQWLPIRWKFVDNNATARDKEARYGDADFKGPAHWQAMLQNCVNAWWDTLADAKLLGL